jgi:pyruvate dehydrogenase E2 component (dihydrolipoamide acetyltransferase)
MAEVILMPRLSDTMTEGVIAAWHKKVGDAVKKGDLLAEVETDKATMDLESYKDGTLLYIGTEKGGKLQVNDLMAIIGNQGENVDDLVKQHKGGGSAPAAAPKEEAPKETKEATGETKADKEVKTPSGPNPEQASQPEREGTTGKGEEVTPASSEEGGRVKASPLAKKLASEKGIDIAQVPGSGDNGRIVKADIDNYKSTEGGAQKAAAPAGQVSFEDVPVSQMRKTIAKRLSESKFTAPEFYLTMSIDMDAAVAARTRINETAKVKISFNDIVLKAVAVALKQHPKVNSSWMGDKIRVNHHVNIGVAVAVEEGLLVPVVRFADSKSLSQISAEVKDFAQKAKDKKLQPADWEGSTFTISNLGMFGIDEFTAIINPPDACILAVSAIQQIPVVKNGIVAPGNVMKVTLTCDHRVVDGATGAAFLQTLKGLLEEPLRMLV